MVKTHRQKQKKLDLAEEMEGGRELYSAVAMRTTCSSACQQEEKAWQELNKQLMSNLSPPAQAIPHSPKVRIKRLTDEKIRGTGSGTDTDSGASSMETDWVIPDLRNIRLSDANPIPLDQQVTANQQGRGKTVLVRCHSLKPYFKVTCFQINVQTGQMYMHTQPAMDVGINCQMEEFDLDILKARLDAMAPPPESQQNEGTLPRIPLVQRTGPINEIMTEQEAWDILNRYKELCKLYATAYHELAICTRYSTVERVKACSLLEPYISDVLEKVDAALAIFCMEN